MKTITISYDPIAFVIDGHAIEDIFLDETGIYTVNPKEYYNLTQEQIDLFLSLKNK